MNFRKALSASIPYDELQTLYQSKGTPGCPGILPSLYLSKNGHKKEQPEDFCYHFDLAKAKKFWGQAFSGAKAPGLALLYSAQGGDDHKRSMEFLQAQWLKNLGARIEVSPLENKLFVEKLKADPPDVFRKGIAPERPTCLSGLQYFETHHPENLIGFSNPEFDALLLKLEKAQSQLDKKKLCRRGLHLLLGEAWMIPTGPLHFSLLVSKEWQSWKLNELNQLDLSDLHFVAAPPPAQ